MDERQRRKNQLIGIVGAMTLLFALAMFGSRQTPEERITAQVRRHYGAIVFVRSGTGRDQPFLETIEAIRPLMRGAAALIAIDQSQAEFLGRETQANAPALVVIEAHGQELHRFHGALDEEDLARLDASVRRIAWHQQVSAGGRYNGGDRAE